MRRQLPTFLMVRTIAEIKDIEGRPWRVVTTHWSDRLITCADDGFIRLWNVRWFGTTVLKRGQPPRIENHFGEVVAKFPFYAKENDGTVTRGEFAAFSPYEVWLVTAYQQRVSFRNPHDGMEMFGWPLKLPEGQRIMAIRFSPHGNTLFAFLENANATEQPSLKFMQYAIDAREDRPFIGTHGVVDGRATVNGKYVITWDGSSEIVFWDQENATEAKVLKVAPNNVYDVAFSPMGDVMATAGDDGEVKFWKVANQSQLKTEHPFKHDQVDLVQFSNDGKFMVTAGDDGWLRGWDTPKFISRDPETVPKVTEFDRESHTVTETLSDGRVKSFQGQ